MAEASLRHLADPAERPAGLQPEGGPPGSRSVREVGVEQRALDEIFSLRSALQSAASGGLLALAVSLLLDCLKG